MERMHGEFLPISSLGTLAYCPRSFYYQVVQGEAPTSEFLLEGQLAHQWVHQPGTHTGAEGELLSDSRQWPFPGRIKRPASDPVNALLSFGYALLTNRVASAVQVVGFDHFVGYLHSTIYGRPALALDLVEEFRPIIVDALVLTVLNKRILTPTDFVSEHGAYRLKDDRRKIFFTQFEARLGEEVVHPLFGYKATYQRCLELQARLLAKVLTGEIDDYPPLLVK